MLVAWMMANAAWAGLDCEAMKPQHELSASSERTLAAGLRVLGVGGSASGSWEKSQEFQALNADSLARQAAKYQVCTDYQAGVYSEAQARSIIQRLNGVQATLPDPKGCVESEGIGRGDSVSRHEYALTLRSTNQCQNAITCEIEVCVGWGSSGPEAQANVRNRNDDLTSCKKYTMNLSALDTDDDSVLVYAPYAAKLAKYAEAASLVNMLVCRYQ
jgi:hypothetical protein